jgi:serine phosphatase RsbU (regulator of sigma subunit)
MKPITQLEADSLHRSVESLTVELLSTYEELSLLYSLGAQIGHLTNPDEIASVALRQAMDVLPADCGWVVFWEGETSRVPENCRTNIEAVTVELITQVALRPLQHKGKAQLLSNALTEDYLLDMPGVPERFLASGLRIRGATGGYLCLGRRDNGSVFTSTHQKLINAVASFTAVEIENLRLRYSELEKQRLAGELELARQIQQSLLPSDFSRIKFIKASGFSEPCSEIGGDYFDVIPIGSDACLLVIADVTGKGPPAALQAALVQGVVHGSSRHSLETSWLMTTLNECILARGNETRFVTAFLANLDSAGCLRYTNAGHNPPLLIHQDGQITQLSEGGLLLGFVKAAGYAQSSAQLAPGDALVLYTDGVTDAMNADEETFGMPRLLEWAGCQAGKSAAEVQKSLLAALKQFCGRTRKADDLSLLVIRYKGQTRQRSVV